MKLAPAAFSLATVLCLAALEATPAIAQSTFTDPANLSGERVSPRDGHELPLDQGATGLQQLLRKLNTRASLMSIVAHPDDEDGGMLTLYSRGLGARVADLSLNRGEGGQNAMTADFEDALGLLRTQELLASDRYTGVDQFFGTQVDFGFSKTKQESFQKWGHDRVLYDVVRAIRIYRPLVLTSTWIGGVTDGHGHHQVSGQIAQEAFVAAGDPKVFPELTAEGILPWQPLKIYARVPMQAITPQGLFDYATGQYVPAEFHNYITGETTTAAPSVDVVVHEGTKDPLITYAGAHSADLSTTGPADTVLSYIQFSRIGLGLQKSQIGPGVRNAPSGAFDVSYHLYGDLTCSALVTLKPQAQSASSQAPLPQNCHPERSLQDAVEGPASPPAAANPLAPSDLSSQPNFFDGIDTSIEGITDLAPHAPPSLRSELKSVANDVAQAQQALQSGQRENVVRKLQMASSEIRCISQRLGGNPNPNPDVECILSDSIGMAKVAGQERANVEHELQVKQAQLSHALLLAMDVQATATAPSIGGTLVPGEPFTITVHASSPIAWVYGGDLQGTWVRGESQDKPSPTGGGATTTTLHVSEAEARRFSPTTPYFHRSNIEAPVYELSEQALRTAPQTPWPLIVNVNVTYGSIAIKLPVVVCDQTTGHPLLFVPPNSLSLSSHAQVLPNDHESLSLTATVSPFTAITSAPMLTVPMPWKLEDMTFSKTGENLYTANDPSTGPGTTVWKLSAPSKNRQPILVKATATYGGQFFTEGYRPIGYGDLPRTNLYTPATTRIVPVDLKLPEHHKIAYLPGTGDSIPEALASLNLTPTILTVADLVPENLKQYDTVILGVRTYNAHPDLHGGPTQALLEYTRNGGNVLVQFQTTEFTADDAPYPLSFGSNEKVVDETAPVQLLTKTNPILTTPNLLTPADFNGWNEERGHGFLSTWDSHYTSLFEVHDPGVPAEHVLPQKPQRGGLLTVQLGKGRWTYCSFALYRQLPEAVPGAFRLFANLITP